MVIHPFMMLGVLLVVVSVGCVWMCILFAAAQFRPQRSNRHGAGMLYHGQHASYH